MHNSLSVVSDRCPHNELYSRLPRWFCSCRKGRRWARHSQEWRADVGQASGWSKWQQELCSSIIPQFVAILLIHSCPQFTSVRTIDFGFRSCGTRLRVSLVVFSCRGAASKSSFNQYNNKKVFKNCQVRPYAPILLDERHVEEANDSFTSWSELGWDLNKYLSCFPDIPLPFPLFCSCWLHVRKEASPANKHKISLFQQESHLIPS